MCIKICLFWIENVGNIFIGILIIMWIIIIIIDRFGDDENVIYDYMRVV